MCTTHSVRAVLSQVDRRCCSCRRATSRHDDDERDDDDDGGGDDEEKRGCRAVSGISCESASAECKKVWPNCQCGQHARGQKVVGVCKKAASEASYPKSLFYKFRY